MAPDAPSNLDIDTGNSIATNNVVLTWTNNAAPLATTNEIWRSVNGAAYALLASVGGGVATYSDPIAGMLPGDVNQYEVRACNGATCSAFTVDVAAAKDLGTLQLAAYNYPTLILIFDSLDTVGGGNAVTVNLPKLRRVQATFGFSNEPNLTSVSVPELVQIGAGFEFTSDGALTSLTITALATIGSDFNLNGIGACPVSAPALVTVGSSLSMTAANIPTASFPVITTVGISLRFDSCPTLSSFSSPNLTIIGVDLQGGGCITLNAVNFTALQSVGGEIRFDNDTNLLSLSFPVLTALAGNFDISGSAIDTMSFGAAIAFQNNLNCQAVDLANLTMATTTFADFSVIDFSNASIVAGNSAAGTGINGILRRGAASPGPLTSADFELQGGTNAGVAALSAQGATDLAFLTGNGCIVNMNP